MVSNDHFEIESSPIFRLFLRRLSTTCTLHSWLIAIVSNFALFFAAVIRIKTEKVASLSSSIYCVFPRLTSSFGLLASNKSQTSATTCTREDEFWAEKWIFLPSPYYYFPAVVPDEKISTFQTSRLSFCTTFDRRSVWKRWWCVSFVDVLTQGKRRRRKLLQSEKKKKYPWTRRWLRFQHLFLSFCRLAYLHNPYQAQTRMIWVRKCVRQIPKG